MKTTTRSRITPRTVLATAVLLLAACGGGGGDAAAPAPPGPPAAAQERSYAFALSGGARQDSPVLALDVVVMLATGVAVEAVASTHGLSVLDRFGQRPIWRLRLGAGQTLEGVIAALNADVRVRFAEPNAVSTSPEGKQQVVWAIGGDAAAAAAQWGPGAIALPAAHTASLGSAVRVAVLDTGIDLLHPAFGGRLARDGNGAVLGRDFVDDDNDASETGISTDAGWGHGTHVASIVAMTAPQARLMPVRVLNAAGRGNVWVLVEALMWAVDPDGDPRTDDGARVINISLGTTAPTRLLNSAVELATCSDDDDDEADDDYSDPGFAADRERCNLRPGVVVMAAAGNSGSATERIYPAAERAEGQLAITATQIDGSLAAFGNRGTWVQLAAPGDRIVGAVPGGLYATWSGSSMAAPWASGTAALVLAANPDWKPVDVTKRLLDRSQKLCPSAEVLRGLHAHGAVADFVPADRACP
jgi:subtilisin family serine protease